MLNKSPPTPGSPVSVLKGVGPRIQDKLNRLGIYTIQDLLFYLPRTYIDRTRLTPIGALRPGSEVLIQGVIELVQIKYGRRRSLLCRISDGTGSILLRFFYFSRSQQNNLERNRHIRCFGQVRTGASSLEIIHPEYQFIDEDKPAPVEEYLTPVYRTTENLQQVKLRQLAGQALAIFIDSRQEIAELLPGKILDDFGLMDINSAIKFVHHPPPDISIDNLVSGNHPAQQRLAFEELLAQYLALKRFRQKTRQHSATPITTQGNLCAEFINSLPFELTAAQKKSVNEISRDMTREVPMLRLLQGDVGSGKTVVAALAALKTVEAGYQVAIMAPTELLAEQHFHNFSAWLTGFDIQLLLLTGRMRQSEKKESLEAISGEDPVVAIGTHALFQKDIHFAKLRLIIIDEQHRFGVHQRLSLLEKGKEHAIIPHQLIMTATPIPRTLAMTVYADLDLSIIDKIPPGRHAVNTVAISSERRDEVIQRIRQACEAGRQVFWVCTLIEESEVLQCEAAVNTYHNLSEKLPGIKIALIHGRMKNRDKELAMSAFKAGEINLLVSTTVIEVGVDVPNASLMIIENAERLGLFQLHQLRGRVGRGHIKSDCVLLFQAPLSDMAKSRLQILRESNDGFTIAEKDLELRGPGELMGTRQTGLPDLKIADLARDTKLLPSVHKAANIILDNNPELIHKIIKRWLGHDTRFIKV